MYVPHDDGDQHGDGGFLDDSADNHGGIMDDAEVSGNQSYNPLMHLFNELINFLCIQYHFTMWLG